MNTTNLLISILGTAILGLCAYIFTQLRGEFRDFKNDVKAILADFRGQIKDTNDNMLKILDGFDNRLRDVESKRKKK